MAESPDAGSCPDGSDRPDEARSDGARLGGAADEEVRSTRVDIVTLFPEMFPGVFSSSIPRIAQERGRLTVNTVNLRDFAPDRRGTVDDRPFGGGAGMVLMCGPVFDAVAAIEAGMAARRDPAPLRVLFSPQGHRLDQPLVEALAAEPALLLLCGHYEGFDERIRTGLRPLEISVGDYVLSGGELPAMTLVDAIARLQPGVVGDPQSVEDDSFSNQGRLLEYPHYTRPREFRGMTVPDVLLSGHHGKVEEWRRAEAIARTRERRPELLDEADANRQDNQGERSPADILNRARAAQDKTRTAPLA